MPKFDKSLSDIGFAVCSTIYAEHYQNSSQNRIVIELAPSQDKSQSIRAIVDTGSPWCIISPEIAENWDKFISKLYRLQKEKDWDNRHNIRGIKFAGWIAQMDTIILASSGESPVVQAKFFVPENEHGQDYLFPNFIGLDGMLNSMRFAIDPFENAFYFGVR